MLKVVQSTVVSNRKKLQEGKGNPLRVRLYGLI